MLFDLPLETYELDKEEVSRQGAKTRSLGRKFEASSLYGHFFFGESFCVDRVMDENEIGSIIVDRSIKVHMSVGPGLLERVYEAIIAFELSRAGLDVQRQVPIPINYGTLSFNEGFRADLIVEGKVIIELKCVEKITYAHRKQVLTYLRLSRMKLGFILNFSAAFMKDGLHRMVNGLEI